MFLDQKGPKMRFYKFHEKWTCGIFQVFCIKIQQLKVLELIVMIVILGEILFSGEVDVFWLKGAKIAFQVQV